VNEQRWGGSCGYDLFERAATGVVAALDVDEIDRVLVHCHRGRNRSAAICAAALAAHRDESLSCALTQVCDARTVFDPNDLMVSHARRFVEDGGNARRSVE